jgi:glycosyltransferase involved in cell wall biosynthesis
MKPKLGVLDFWPIQYHSPLYQRLESRGNVAVDVLYLSDNGCRNAIDPKFGVPVVWDIDLLSGYQHTFLTTKDAASARFARFREARVLAQWLATHDAVVIHGYSNPWMLFAMAICRARRIPYLLRGDSLPQGQSAGARRLLRDLVAGSAVSGSAGGLAIGKHNQEFYRRLKARRIISAPYSVDDVRFSRAPVTSRSELLARWGLPEDRAVIMYCGKMYPGKRPLDLISAIRLLPSPVTTVFVGDGVLADKIRSMLTLGDGVVTGFVNQAELPTYYHAADIIVLPSEVENWGLVLNEAMAAGVLPVASDRVGAVPDLVAGLGEVYPCGDIAGLAAALGRALSRVNHPHIRERVRQHAAKYSLERTAAGFEEAMFAVGGRHRTAV